MPRREFLFEIQYWEVQRIIRGYRRRHVLDYQLLRLNAYMSCYSMRENKSGLSPSEWLPMPFDDYDEEESAPITQEEENDLLNMMSELNSGEQ